MEGIGRTMAGRQIIQKKNPKLHSEVHVLADEMCKAFGEPKSFRMFLGAIGRVGIARARVMFSEVMDGWRCGKVRKPASLFMYKCKR